MFWIALLSGVMALFFVQYGALSVTVKLLSAGIGFMVFAAVAIAVVLLARKLWSQKSGR